MGRKSMGNKGIKSRSNEKRESRSMRGNWGG